MEIRFISSLTAEDENVFAPALLKAIGALLDHFPIAYTMRIETIGAQVFQHASGGVREPELAVGRAVVDAPHLARRVIVREQTES
jgi:hypothetical protein